jgi:hypothetical protein
MNVVPERYEDFLGDLPQFALDTRQQEFLSAVGPAGAVKKAKIDQRLGKVEIANVGRGWPASAPNLGFLQDSMGRLVELGKLDPTSKKEVTQFVHWAVQRVVRLTISSDRDVTHVRFWTKDDFGVYGFEFSVGAQPSAG